MRVIVYVEGPSDQLAMQELLRALLDRLQASGVMVRFLPTNGKAKLITQTPVKAANIILNDPDAVVIALPDLHPANLGGDHTSAAELASLLRAAFSTVLAKHAVDDQRMQDRFRVHCFKHDLEALVLAARVPLASRLGKPPVKCSWTIPVEDQDMDLPPKRIVERLFEERSDRYKDTIDAPLILGAARYSEVAAACPQCFKPFVDYLESLLK